MGFDLNEGLHDALMYSQVEHFQKAERAWSTMMLFTNLPYKIQHGSHAKTGLARGVLYMHLKNEIQILVRLLGTRVYLRVSLEIFEKYALIYCMSILILLRT